MQTLPPSSVLPPPNPPPPGRLPAADHLPGLRRPGLPRPDRLRGRQASHHLRPGNSQDRGAQLAAGRSPAAAAGQPAAVCPAAAAAAATSTADSQQSAGHWHGVVLHVLSCIVQCSVLPALSTLPLVAGQVSLVLLEVLHKSHISRASMQPLQSNL